MKFIQSLFVILPLLFLNVVPSLAQNYLHTEGEDIVDANGDSFIIRSMGIGGWMLQEGYHMNTAGAADTQHEIEKKLVDLTSEDFKEKFYNRWLNNHFTRRDLDSLKVWGFNAVRPALHYKWFTPPVEEAVPGKVTWRQKGFALLDSLIKWCTTNEMYLILDLHAAPGGQGYNASINDYDTTKPSLWESKANRQKTIALWKKIASRCAKEPWVGGYDLINETNWTFEGNFDGDIAKNGCQDTANSPLRKLLGKITSTIRKVDTNHMIIIEGNCWANNFSGLTPPWDDNMVYSFHKYWNDNDKEAIQEFLDLRSRFNVPIWLGETGENSNTWFTECISLMEEHQIGWSWWTVKQLNDIDDPFIIPQNPEYRKTVAYWRGEGVKPGRKEVKKGFLQLAEDAKLENCVYHKDVIDAMFRRVKISETKPFKPHTLPGRVFAVDYDMGRVRHAWYDTEYQNLDMNTTPNKGHAYRNDGVDITTCTDSITNGLKVGWIEDGEWMQYTVEVKKAGTYDFAFRVSSEVQGGIIKLMLNGKPVFDEIKVPVTDGFKEWKTISPQKRHLEKGKHKIKIVAKKGGFHLNYFEVGD
ncbi:MAG: cellulase family glycosylhydrolase [Bacteroidales bacterium]|nr:cellulase family glycosylhydrolase [Bacteroidales bacterium]MCF8333663.1 cellulase family glycosylhydrolase [Bacteroidales bacterium]